MILTKHAEQRCQERLINSKQLDWLLCYGEESNNRGVCLLTGIAICSCSKTWTRTI